MGNHLYFIMLLSRALQEPDVVAALHRALSQITDLGRQPEYGEGWAQWQAFMAQVREHWDAEAEVLRQVAVSLIEDMILAESLMVAIPRPPQQEEANRQRLSAPKWSLLVKQSREAFQPFLPRHRYPSILVTCRGRTLASIPTSPSPASHRVEEVLPGQYQIALDSGRVLWEGELTRADLLWEAAFPELGLAMAADTEEDALPTTRDIVLLDGAVVLRTSPGMEHGHLLIEIMG